MIILSKEELDAIIENAKYLNKKEKATSLK